MRRFQAPGRTTPSQHGLSPCRPTGVSTWAGVIVTDLNVFIWPGIDIFPVPRMPSGTYAYGFLPPLLFERIRERIMAIGSAGTATRRTE